MNNQIELKQFSADVSIFQTSKPRVLCTKMQLMLVLTTFVGSLLVAIALAEKPNGFVHAIAKNNENIRTVSIIKY